MVEAFYLQLPAGELQRRAAQAFERMRSCDLCPWGCKVNRLEGKLGVCRSTTLACLSGYGPHHGEEHPLSGTRGSGTVFFGHCNLRCVFCQNWEISQLAKGREVTSEELVAVFLELQSLGCHNINLVSPSHMVPQILGALAAAVPAGLSLPLVYNSGGYDALSTLQLLDGVVDIYMPDMKYGQAAIAKQFSGVRDYPQINRAAVKEMYRQVGDLVLDEDGIAVRGLLVRHLVLPGRLADTPEVVRFLAKEISPDTYLNIMDQYHPDYQAARFPQLNRPITPAEYAAAVEAARKSGMMRLDH
jgi:putative pyruvate formate lyase activating enzyme